MSAEAPKPLKLCGFGHRMAKVKVVAAFAGVELDVDPDFTMGVTNKTPEYLAMNDQGKARNMHRAPHRAHL